MMRREFMVAAPALAAATAAVSASASAQPQNTEAAIRATAMDYIEGWYAADAERMARALHPELCKRILRRSADGSPQLQQMSAMTLVQLTRSHPAQALGRRDMKVLDVFRGAASVRLDAGDWVDYLHLAEVEPGRWQIVNVLWELRA